MYTSSCNSLSHADEKGGGGFRFRHYDGSSAKSELVLEQQKGIDLHIAGYLNRELATGPGPGILSPHRGTCIGNDKKLQKRAK